MAYIEKIIEMKNSGQLYEGMNYNNSEHLEIFYNALLELGIDEEYLSNPKVYDDLWGTLNSMNTRENSLISFSPNGFICELRNVATSSYERIELKSVNGKPLINKEEQMTSGQKTTDNVSYSKNEDSFITINSVKYVVSDSVSSEIKETNKYDFNGICVERDFIQDSKYKNAAIYQETVHVMSKRNPDFPIIDVYGQKVVDGKVQFEESNKYFDKGLASLDVNSFDKVTNSEELDAKIKENEAIIVEQIKNNVSRTTTLKDYYANRYSNYPDIIENCDLNGPTYN